MMFDILLLLLFNDYSIIGGIYMNPGYPVWIFVLIGAVVLFNTIGLIVAIIIMRHNKRGRPIMKAAEREDFITALGGRKNIKQIISAIGSRLTLELYDYDVIDRDRLRLFGVSSVLVMSSKVTLVVEGQAQAFAASLDASLSQQPGE